MTAAFSDRISSSPSKFAKFWSLMFPRGSDYSPGRQATSSRGLQNSIVPGKSPNRRCKVTLHLYEYGVYQLTVRSRPPLRRKSPWDNWIVWARLRTDPDAT